MAGKRTEPRDYGGIAAHGIDGFVASRIIGLGIFIGRYFPTRVSYWLVFFLIRVVSRFLPSLRRRIAENISFVSEEEIPGPALNRMVYENIVATFGLKWMDVFVLPRLSKGFVDEHITIEGLEHYRAAQEAGRGVLLVTWHVGTFPLLCYLALPHLGGAVLAPFRRIFDDRAQLNIEEAVRSHGGECAHPGGAVRPIVNSFKTGGTVVLAADHLTSPTGIRVNYFGRETLIPSGPASFACRYRPVTLGAYCVKTGPKQYRIVFSAPFAIPAVEKKVEASHLREMAETYTRYFEGVVRAYPTQWECFFPLWPADFDETAIKEFGLHYGVVDEK
jgi:KDO2-lipid IV(A) lauroyltransferase